MPSFSRKGVFESAEGQRTGAGPGTYRRVPTDPADRTRPEKRHGFVRFKLAAAFFI